jgi:hypothetical protein
MELHKKVNSPGNYTVDNSHSYGVQKYGLDGHTHDKPRPFGCKYDISNIIQSLFNSVVISCQLDDSDRIWMPVTRRQRLQPLCMLSSLWTIHN